MTINIIAALDSVGGIGKDGKLPWHFPEDLKRFKQLTKDSVVIMGRKTWDSLPKKPLKDRINVVVSRNAELIKRMSNEIYPVSVYFSSEFLLRFWQDISPTKKCWIIGGAEIYKQTLERCDYLYLTRLTGDYKCDTFFPEFKNLFELETVRYMDCDVPLEIWKRRKNGNN